MTTSITHWADGRRLDGASDRWADVTNPATGQVSGRVALADEAAAAAVIASAARAAKAWGRRPWPRARRCSSPSVSCSTAARASWRT